MVSIRQTVPIDLTLHPPRTPEGKLALEQRTAGIHADAALRLLRDVNCPAKQKQELAAAISRAAKEK